MSLERGESRIKMTRKVKVSKNHKHEWIPFDLVSFPDADREMMQGCSAGPTAGSKPSRSKRNEAITSLGNQISSHPYRSTVVVSWLANEHLATTDSQPGTYGDNHRITI